MDVFVVIVFVLVLIVFLNDKGYFIISDKLKMIGKVGVFVCGGLVLVYGGLCFFGVIVLIMYGIDVV